MGMEKTKKVEINDLYFSVNIIRTIQIKKNEMGGACRTYEREGLVDRPDRQRQLGRPTCGWEDNLKVDLQEVGWEGVDWILLVQDRRALVNAVMNLRIP